MSMLAVLAPARGSPPRVMVKVAVPGVSSAMLVVEAMSKLTPTSVSVMSVLATVCPALMVAFTAPPRVAVRVSVPSTRVSLTACTVKPKVGPTKLLSKVSVVPARLTPVVAVAAAPSRARKSW